MTVASVLLVESLFGCSGVSSPDIRETSPVVASKPVPELKHWAAALNEYCRDLGQDSLSVAEWQTKLGELFDRIELNELLRFIDFEKLRFKLELPDIGVVGRQFDFPRIAGFTEETVFISKIFGLKRGRAIIPHGHSNMASGHLVLEGSFFLRQYDKIENRGSKMKIRSTVEKKIDRSEFSSISDDRDNVHWFVAETGPSYAFDVIMLDLAGKQYDIHNLDMDNAVELPGGELEVPVIGVEEALSKYGKVARGDRPS